MQERTALDSRTNLKYASSIHQGLLPPPPAVVGREKRGDRMNERMRNGKEGNIKGAEQGSQVRYLGGKLNQVFLSVKLRKPAIQYFHAEQKISCVFCKYKMAWVTTNYWLLYTTLHARCLFYIFLLWVHVLHWLHIFFLIFFCVK